MTNIVDINDIVIRQMTVSDVPEVMIAIRGHYSVINYFSRPSLETCLAIDGSGLFVAIDSTNDRVVGLCGGTFVRPDVAFFGFFLVHNEYCGRGIGGLLSTRAMDRIGDRNCCLLSKTTASSLYRNRFGFAFEAKPKVIYYREVLSANRLIIDVNIEQRFQCKPILSERMAEEVIEYDQHIHHYRRDALLRTWFARSDCLTLAAVDTSDGHIIGFGSMSAAIDGNVCLQPLYANSYVIAKQLIHSLITLSKIDDKCVLHLFAITSNENSLTIANELSLKSFGEFSMLFKSEIIDCFYQNVYSIFSSRFSM